MTVDELVTSPRLTALLGLRAFLDVEIATERHRLFADRLGGNDYINAACAMYGVTLDELVAHTRAKREVEARQMACWLLRESGHSLSEIGRWLNRDHTTIQHSCRAVENDPARRALGRSLLAQTRQATG